jgi:membrane protein implicated in regulation of membrane protease activity
MTDTYIIWFLIVGVLLIIEMLSFSTYVLWIAIGACLTGIVAFIFPTLDNIIELLIFALFSSVGLFIGFKFFSASKAQLTSNSVLNQRGSEYINEIYTLEQDTVDGHYYLKIFDTIWRVECKFDVAHGTKVKVIAIHGNRLVVEPYADN